MSTMMKRFAISITLLLVVCLGYWLLRKPTFHSIVGWKAEDYFEDLQVQELCHAIEQNDLAKMKALIASGVDVSATGKDGMTPLLWAFPDQHLERFRVLLESGADPNVAFESDFNTKAHLSVGDSVTALAARTRPLEYLPLVLQFKGNADFRNEILGETLLSIAADSPFGRRSRVREVLKKGAKINARNRDGGTALFHIVSTWNDYEFGNELIDRGADPFIYHERFNYNLIHRLVWDRERIGTMSQGQRAGYDKMVKRLIELGASFESAEADIARWDKWSSKSIHRQSELREKDAAARRARTENADKCE